MILNREAKTTGSMCIALLRRITFKVEVENGVHLLCSMAIIKLLVREGNERAIYHQSPKSLRKLVSGPSGRLNAAQQNEWPALHVRQASVFRVGIKVVTAFCCGRGFRQVTRRSQVRGPAP
jgi:hypothetical protein